MRKIITLLSWVLFGSIFCANQGSVIAENNRIDDMFAGFNSEYVSGFTKPLFTTLQQGLNSNLYVNNAFRTGQFSIGLDVSANAMTIPESQKYFSVKTPSEWQNSKIIYLDENGNTVYKKVESFEEPTIYGHKSTPIFSTDSLNNGSLVNTYLEGLGISQMSSLPNIQVIVGLPTQTEIRIRGFAAGGASFYGFVVNQRLDDFLNIFGSENNSQSLGVTLAYHSINYNYSDTDVYGVDNDFNQLKRTIDINANMGVFAFGLNYNYEIINNLRLYSGIQIEGVSGKVEGHFYDNSAKEIKDNIVEANISSYSSYRATLGLSYQLLFMEFHTDATYSSQPMITAGVSFWIGRFGGN